ncbi:MAG: flagellar basal-body rod protein FlgF [Alphaproteobacteria bacterium]|nr:flagellar basal-body rod protein FlgF [Alphaproteobacteria bacterium]
MEGPTYVALSAQVALQKQLDAVANNIANINTTGFKGDRQLFQSYVERLNVPGGAVSFVQDRATYIDRKEGEINLTQNPWDVAIKGDAYLGVTSGSDTLYTRDGHLQLGQDGTLMSSNGLPVVGPDKQPIQIPPNAADPEIKADGSITVQINGVTQQIGQLGMFRASDPLSMRKSGNSMLSAPSGAMVPVENGDANASIVQGGLEGSTVQPVAEIANLTELSRAYDRLQTLLSDDNDREQKMIQTLSQPT